MYGTITIATRARKAKADAVAITVRDTTGRLPDAYTELDASTDGMITAALKRSEFSATAGQVTTLYPDRGPHRIFLTGIGSANRDDGHAVRLAASQLARTAYDAGVSRLDLRLLGELPDTLDINLLARAVGDGIAIANFKFAEFKGKADGSRSTGSRPARRKASRLELTAEPTMRPGIKRGLLIGQSVNLARRLAATPPNIAHPAFFTAHCRQMARRTGLKCTIINAMKAKQLGLGGLLAVGSAGSRPPALIALEHCPPGKAKAPPVMLVGKAVTFDTGGYSLKPRENMDAMKYDKCGGMAVIGAMDAVARLKLPVRVIGLVAAAENLISADAYRPGDIITMANGVTVEITNTDAEGRLVLGDAMVYGCRTYKPRAIIDLATLTGGVVTALGSSCAGCFCNDDRLLQQLLESADFTGERLWHLPLWEEHRKQIKGSHGDIVNSAGRGAQPIQGAAFLSHFVGERGPCDLPDLPWAHLDIAGVSNTKGRSEEESLFPSGPTGFGVRLLVRWLEKIR